MPLIELKCLGNIVSGSLSAYRENLAVRALNADLINSASHGPAQRRGYHVIKRSQDHVLAVDHVSVAVTMRIHYEEIFEGTCLCL